MKKSSIFPVLSYILVSLTLVIFQSSRRFSLWDFANYTDLGIRIAKGQIPYIDFPLYTQPGSFYEIAFFTKFLGQNIYVIYLPIVLKLALLGVLVNLILNKVLLFYGKTSILKRILIMVGMSFLNPWFIVPQPTYDADLAFAVILSFFLVLISLDLKDKSITRTSKVSLYSLIIISAWLPFFYKQTSGLIWIILIHIFVIIFKRHLPKYLVTSLLVGDSLILTIFYLFQEKYNLVSYWINDAIKYPSEVRLTSSRSPLNQLLQIGDYKIDLITILIFTFILFLAIKRKSKDLFFTTFLFSSSIYLT